MEKTHENEQTTEKTTNKSRITGIYRSSLGSLFQKAGKMKDNEESIAQKLYEKFKGKVNETAESAKNLLNPGNLKIFLKEFLTQSLVFSWYFQMIGNLFNYFWN